MDTIDMTTIELARKYGLEDGMRQGVQQGLERGRSEERARIAREMRRAGVSIEQIALFMRLTVTEVERL